MVWSRIVIITNSSNQDDKKVLLLHHWYLTRFQSYHRLQVVCFFRIFSFELSTVGVLFWTSVTSGRSLRFSMIVAFSSFSIVKNAQNSSFYWIAQSKYVSIVLMTDSSASELSPLLLRNVSSRRSSLQRSAINAKISIWLILISAGFERVAFYSLAGNLILFLTSNHARWSPMHAVTVSFIFLGNSTMNLNGKIIINSFSFQRHQLLVRSSLCLAEWWKIGSC